MRTLKNQCIRYTLPVLVSARGTRIYFFLWLFFFLQLPLTGQEDHIPEQEEINTEQITPVQEQTRDTENPEEPSSTETYTGKTIFYIRNIGFDIIGRTRPFALLYYGEFREGERIEGGDQLTGYIRDKTQLLLNQRVFDTVQIDYTFGDVEENGLVPVDLLVKVVDTWNIIALPYPKYDSNTGIEFIIKARDYNFWGTMSPLRLDLGYGHKSGDGEPSKDVLKFEIDSNIPFNALGYNWNLDFDHFFSYTLINENSFVSYKNISGVSIELPWNFINRQTTFTFGVEQDFIVGEENDDKYKDEYGDYANYMSSKLYGSWKIPWGITVYGLGEMISTPELSGKINYPYNGELEYWRKDPAVTLGHRLGFGRIDWIGNYRSGLEFTFKHSHIFNFYKKGWDNDYSITLTGHRILTDFLGVSGLLQFRHWIYSVLPEDRDRDFRHLSYTNAGDVLRGILDKSVAADYMLSLNLNFPFLVLRFFPSEWLDDRGLRFINFDFQVSPFIDIALLQGVNNIDREKGVMIDADDVSFSFEDVQFTGGLEFMVFPAFMRSFYLRASFGFNLIEWVKTGRPPVGNNREIFIGIGHHY